jgi:hypothetical protein
MHFCQSGRRALGGLKSELARTTMLPQPGTTSEIVYNVHTYRVVAATKPLLGAEYSE